MNIDARLSDLARRHPDRPALVGTEVLTWQQLDARTAERTAELRTDPAGLRTDAARARTDSARARTDVVVAVDAGNEPAAALEVIAYLRAGVPVLPLNPLIKAAERAAVVAELQRRGLGVAYRGEVLAAPTSPPAEPTFLPAEPTFLPAEPTGPPAVAYALLTGGSTGTPKPVLFPAPLTWSPRTYPNPLLVRTGWRDDQRQLVVAPLHHAAAFSVFLAGVLCGNTIALLPAFHRDLFWQTLAELDIEWLLLTPAHMRAALPGPGRPASSGTPDVTVLHTGAPCEPEVKRAWLDLVGPRRLFEMYGSTEGTGVTLVRGDEWLARPGTVGRGVWTRIRVLDKELREVPTGTVGEVYLRTPAPPRLRHPGQRATPDGYLSIGDHGWVDGDGYLYLTGRGDDLIIVGGENVYPAEIEAVLRSHPAVVDAAVVGTPDPVLGQRARAFVIARDLSTDELRRHCAGRLSSFKLPADVTFVDELPRSALGKLQRRRLT